MIKRRTVTLIAENPEARGVFETATETGRTVKCTEKSIGTRMQSEAKAAGMAPEVRLVLAYEHQYQGEKKCEYGGVEYEIETAIPYEKSNGIELLLKRMEGNADV